MRKAPSTLAVRATAGSVEEQMKRHNPTTAKLRYVTARVRARAIRYGEIAYQPKRASYPAAISMRFMRLASCTISVPSHLYGPRTSSGSARSSWLPGDFSTRAKEHSLVGTGRDLSASHDPYAALHHRDFRLVLLGRFLTTCGEQMATVALGWELYLRTQSTLALGYIGLANILPLVVLSLPAGHFVDQHDRKRIVLTTQSLLAVSALALAALAWANGPIPLIYVCLFIIGVGVAFYQPASTGLLAEIVPDVDFASAATWESSSWQLAAVIGPAIGGLLIAAVGNVTIIFVLYALVSLGEVLLVVPIRPARAPRSGEKLSLRAIFSGARFLGSSQVLLSAITLDLFAVLLGGATTLLPVFALDILRVGAGGLGLLRAAPSIGAVVMAMIIAHLPPFRRTGMLLLAAVAGFGVATIIFGLSRSFPLSLAMLVLLGAFDNISVVIRSTLMLTRTPADMLGRISAIDSLFTGASNELGGFESGVVAAAFTPIISVIAGGIGTIAVVLAVSFIWPEMRKLDRLDGHVQEGQLSLDGPLPVEPATDASASSGGVRQ